MSTRRIATCLPFLLWGIALAALIVGSKQVWQFTADDSFITFRYSSNLIAGHGLRFNQIGAPVEGYTSILWVLIMAIPHLAGGGVVTFAKAFGVICMAGAAMLIAWMVDQYHSERVPAWLRQIGAGIAAFFFCVLPETSVHAVSGMETAISTFLITLLAVFISALRSGSNKVLILFCFTALLAGLARPEANLSIIMLIAWIAWKWNSPNRYRFLLAAGFLYVVPGCVYFLWRWQYFGILFPLPFYVKAGGGGLPGFGAVLAFLIFVLGSFGLYIGIGTFAPAQRTFPLWLIILPQLIFFNFSEPVMGYDHRFLYPYLPVLVILSGYGVNRLLSEVYKYNRGKTWLCLGMSLLILSVFAAPNVQRTGSLFDHKNAYANGLLKNHIAIGNILRSIPHTAEAPILLVSDAGAAPYFSGWRTLDANKLTEPALVFSTVDPLDYLFAHHPAVVMLMSNDLQEFINDSAYARSIYERAISEGLVPVRKRAFYQLDFIWALARPDTPEAFALEQSIK